MNDYLSNLAIRTLSPAATLQPRLFMPFEPVTDALDLMGTAAAAEGEGSGHPSHIPAHEAAIREERSAHSMVPEATAMSIPNNAPWRLDQLAHPELMTRAGEPAPLEREGSLRMEAGAESVRIAEREDRGGSEERIDGLRRDPHGSGEGLRLDAGALPVRSPWEITEDSEGNAASDLLRVQHGEHSSRSEGISRRDMTGASHGGSEAVRTRPDAFAAARVPHSAGDVPAARSGRSGQRDEVFVPTTVNSVATTSLIEPESVPGGSLGYGALPLGHEERQRNMARIEPRMPDVLQVRPIPGMAPRADVAHETGTEQTIRVTIGRIEVRAIMPSQPARPEPAVRRTIPTLSLDEYLRGQKRGNR